MIAVTHPGMTLNALLAEEHVVSGADAVDTASLESDGGTLITGICLDTRLAGAGNLYLALPGTTAHGLHFVRQAIERRVVAIAAEPGHVAAFDSARAAMREAGVTFIEVPRLKQRAGFIAARFFGQPSRAMKLVAVTGTDGKTSVCHFVQSALAALGTRCGYIGTLGWGFVDALDDTELTTPDAVSLQAMLASLREAGAEVVAIEASSHGIAEGRLDAVDIDVAVLTNLGRDHLDYHVSLENYRAAKARLFQWPSLRAQVVNAADPFGSELADRPCTGETITGWTFDSRSDHDVQACRKQPRVLGVCKVRTLVSGLQFSVVEEGVERAVDSALIGHFNIDNLLACCGVLRVLGQAANDACLALEKVSPVPGRMERFLSPDRACVIVDYAHTPEALAAALVAARRHCDGELWVVFGCGGDRDAGKRAPMAAAAELADHVIITDDNPRTEDAAGIRDQILTGLSQPQRALIIADRTRAIGHAVAHSASDDIVLVAGKGHENYQIIGQQRRAYSDRDTVVRLQQEVAG